MQSKATPNPMIQSCHFTRNYKCDRGLAQTEQKVCCRRTFSAVAGGQTHVSFGKTNDCCIPQRGCLIQSHLFFACLVDKTRRKAARTLTHQPTSVGLCCSHVKPIASLFGLAVSGKRHTAYSQFVLRISPYSCEQALSEALPALAHCLLLLELLERRVGQRAE